MKRNDYNRLRNYRPAECCANCAKNEDVGIESGEKPLALLHCTQMISKNVDVIKICKSFVCDAWESNEVKK